MKSLRYFTVQVAIILATVVTSCSKWINLPPKDQITDKVLFTTKEGYLKAVNGIYSELNSTNLYGRDLTTGMLDVMAQYWNTNVEGHTYKVYTEFDYSGGSLKAKLNSVWSTAYTLIANANAILDRVDDGTNVLPPDYYAIVKGETLGLRAFLHFDLLRLYGPIYSIDKQVACIPYMLTSDRSIQPLLSAEEVLNKVIEDLLEARTLLATSDPILTEGTLNFPGEIKNDMNYRQYKMNYFAITALLARVHLWGGNKEKALEYAKEVIAKGQKTGEEIFPFVTIDEVSPSTDEYVSDRMFSNEVIFAGYNTNRSTAYTALFSSAVNPQNMLTFPGNITDGRISRLYDNLNDYRRGMWQVTTSRDTEVTFFTKFEDLFDAKGNSNKFRYMLPLIRISEMHLIVAECDPNLQLAGDAINQIRVHRGIHELEFTDRGDIDNQLELEFIKEFIGEGQLFYFFKRKVYQSIPNGSRLSGGEFPMQLGYYVFPLPESETSQRITY